MPQYRIVATDGSHPPVQISSRDGAAALNVAGQMACGEVDVWEDGLYAFSVRKQGGKAAFWQIFQRPSDLRPERLLTPIAGE